MIFVQDLVEPLIYLFKYNKVNTLLENMNIFVYNITTYLTRVGKSNQNTLRIITITLPYYYRRWTL